MRSAERTGGASDVGDEFPCRAGRAVLEHPDRPHFVAS
jgi:hypothetical protein